MTEGKLVNRHCIIIQGLLQSLDLFSDDEVVEFQAGSLKLMMNIKTQRNAMLQYYNIYIF